MEEKKSLKLTFIHVSKLNVLEGIKLMKCGQMTSHRFLDGDGLFLLGMLMINRR